jgi:phosphate transport system permease protein
MSRHFEETKRYRYRQIFNKILLSYSVLMLILGLTFLFFIMGELILKGINGISFSSFIMDTPPPNQVGGVNNAIIGSCLIVGTAILFATPIGVITGIYLAEYGKKHRLSEWVRFINDLMLSAPSIVLGIFIYGIFVEKHEWIIYGQKMTLGGHFSGWAGSCALGLIALPIVIRTTENMLNLVPNSLREAAFALGMPYSKVILKITLKSAKSGILTGVLLAIARMTGEAAPLLYTALNNQFSNLNMSEPMATLPTTIYKFAMSPYENWQDLAWASALLITLSVLFLNILVKWLSRTKY